MCRESWRRRYNIENLGYLLFGRQPPHNTRMGMRSKEATKKVYTRNGRIYGRCCCCSSAPTCCRSNPYWYCHGDHFIIKYLLVFWIQFFFFFFLLCLPSIWIRCLLLRCYNFCFCRLFFYFLSCSSIWYRRQIFFSFICWKCKRARDWEERKMTQPATVDT